MELIDLFTSKDEQITIWEDYYTKLLLTPIQQVGRICTCIREQWHKEPPVQISPKYHLTFQLYDLTKPKCPITYHRNYWISERHPAEVKEGTITLLPKTGNLSECSSWRGISLLSMVNKRLFDALSPSLGREQAGFRVHHSCIDHVDTCVSLSSSRSNFERVLDTLNHDVIWSSLECKGVPHQIVCLTIELYCGAACRFRQ